MKYADVKNTINRTDYARDFWAYAKGNTPTSDVLQNGTAKNVSGYMLPGEAENAYETEIAKESVFRNLASVFTAYDGASSIYAYDSDDTAEFVPEFGTIDIKGVADDFTKLTVNNHKVATLLKASAEFVHDAAFDFEGYLVTRLSKAFAKPEDTAFVTGAGTDEPIGILDDTAGAEVGVTAEGITYDDIISLYFSVDKDYRKNGVWLMNDTTALTLRTLKDEGGNYLWNQASDTILGRPVVICNDMPDADSGEKPVAFGDFSYYWIVKRSPVTVTTLVERFALNGQIGYLAHEFLDGKLIRQDAVKVLKVQSEVE